MTEVVAGRSFTWEQTSPGVRITAGHHLEPLPGGGTRVRLVVTQTGWLAAVVGRAYRRLTDRYLAMESQGLKARAEQPSG